MEIVKLILEYLKVLVWPIVAFSIALIFKKPILDILERLKKADLPGGVSLDFSEKANEVKQLSEKVETEPRKVVSKKHPAIPLTEANSRMIKLGLQPSPSGLDMQFYRDLALQDPNIALAGLRIEIDVLARNLAKGFKIEFNEREYGARLLRQLLDRKAITKSQFELTRKILNLCNAAVHGIRVSPEQAESVIDSANTLTSQYLNWLSWGFKDNWKPTKTNYRK